MSTKTIKKSNKQVLTVKKEEEISNVKIFKKEGLLVDTDPDYCKKKSPGKLGRPTTLFTNLFGLTPTNTTRTKVYQYEIEISKIFDNGKTAIINKEKDPDCRTNDYFEQTSRQSLVALWPAFHKVLKKYKLAKPESAITDFKRLLFLLDPIHGNYTTVENPKLFFSLVLDKHEIPKTIDVNELEGVVRLEYKLRFTTSFDAFDSIFSNDVSDRDGEQYLALLSSMKVSMDKKGAAIYENGKNYLKDPTVFGFEEPIKLVDGKYLAIGCHKAIKLVEGESKNAGIAFSIDVKRTAFHMNMPLDKKYDELMASDKGPLPFTGANALKVINNVKGLACRCTYLKKENNIIISNVIPENANQKIIDIDGKKMSVAEYYSETYDINLKRPDLPLIEQKKVFNNVKQLCYYPMELLVVAPYQRVKKYSHTSEQILSMIKECETPPKKRINEIHNLFASLQLKNNEFFKEAGILVENKILATPARILKPPVIIAGKGKTFEIRNGNGSWDLEKGDQYNIPSTIENWCAIVIGNKQNIDINKHLRPFLVRYVHYARGRGIKISDNPRCDTCPANEQKLGDLFGKLKQIKVGFVLFITPDFVKHIHNMIKFYERETGIPTQDLKLSTIYKIVEKGQLKTLENIILKSNVKSGGHNYDLKFVVRKDRLIIGIGFNHTMAGDNDSLSVVGYACNTRKITSEFVGDFVYIKFSRDDQITYYENIIKKCVDNFKASRGILPKDVFIYRTSGSEGRYNNYCTFDIPYIKKKLHEAAPEAKFAFIVVHKGHNLRFFKQNINSLDKVNVQNVHPGSVIDQGVTNPKLCDFYLTSHSGILGTAKTPCYTILYDGMNLSMDEFEGVTNGLAYGFQIVNSPTSLPAPICIANQYADRGRSLLNANNHTRGGNNILSNEEEATKTLSYVDSKFNNIRINA
uniref:Piwi domain-containing protein n=1 Tax=Parastrongyloides trichosuri TaxID=131310 RepID=A0A0N4Z170_PARTI